MSLIYIISSTPCQQPGTRCAGFSGNIIYRWHGRRSRVGPVTKTRKRQLAARRWNVVRHASCFFSREFTPWPSIPRLHSHALLSDGWGPQRPACSTDGASL